MSGTNISYLFDLDTSWYMLVEELHVIDGADIFAAISVLTDLICSLLPFPILWSLQLSPRKKIAVGVLMALGAM